LDAELADADAGALRRLTAGAAALADLQPERPGEALRIGHVANALGGVLLELLGLLEALERARAFGEAGRRGLGVAAHGTVVAAGAAADVLRALEGDDVAVADLLGLRGLDGDAGRERDADGVPVLGHHAVAGGGRGLALAELDARLDGVRRVLLALVRV